MKKLTSLLAVISVITATGLGYVGYKNIAVSNNTKEQSMLNQIKSIKKELKTKELELKNIQKILNDSENKKNELTNQINNLDANITSLNDKGKTNKNRLNKLDADL